MISDNVKTGITRSPNRSLLKACGYTDEEINRPFIGVVNSFTEVVPGHIHLNTLAEAVKKGDIKTAALVLKEVVKNKPEKNRWGADEDDISSRAFYETGG